MADTQTPAAAMWGDLAVAAGHSVAPALGMVPADLRDVAAAAAGYSLGLAVGIRVGVVDVAGARALLRDYPGDDGELLRSAELLLAAVEGRWT
jgi:hypothetical protein